MTCAAYVFTLLFGATFGELLLDSLGISLPLVAVVCFYVSIAQGLRCGTACAIAGGVSIDALLGREHPLSVILLLLVVLLAWLWLTRVESTSPLLLCAPGALLPLIAISPWLLPPWEPSIVWLESLFDCVSGTFMAAICSAALLPAAAILFDLAAQALELELFSDAKDNAAGKR